MSSPTHDRPGREHTAFEGFQTRSCAWRASLVCLCAIAVLSAFATARTVRTPRYEFVFTSAPFASSHASTLVELRNHDIMAAWFGGTAEGNADVAIWSSVRSRNGWSKPVQLAREPGTPTWNPVLFYSRDGRLWLYYKFGPGPQSWTAARRWSGNDGKTWSPIEHLPAGLLGPIRTKPLVLANGVIISGSSVESYDSWAVWVERSTDNGKTWREFGPIDVPARYVHPDPSEPRVGIIQPSIVQLNGDHLRLFARPTSRIGRICIADSYDDGVTWTQARPIDVPNPNSGIDAVRLHDGRILLAYNDSTTQRTPLALAESRDGGEHFHRIMTIENSPGEYSYPALIQTSDGAVDMTYTWKRKRIRFVRILLGD